MCTACVVSRGEAQLFRSIRKRVPPRIVPAPPVEELRKVAVEVRGRTAPCVSRQSVRASSRHGYVPRPTSRGELPGLSLTSRTHRWLIRPEAKFVAESTNVAHPNRRAMFHVCLVPRTSPFPFRQASFPLEPEAPLPAKPSKTVLGAELYLKRDKLAWDLRSQEHSFNHRQTFFFFTDPAPGGPSSIKF